MSYQGVVVLLSGGMDSSTLLYYVKELAASVQAISFDYGQRHLRELRSAASIAEAADVPLKVVDLRSLQSVMRGSSQTDATVPVPHGHYADESMRATVVPNRNMVMLSVAAAQAISTGASSVAYAAHEGDHAVYPDCRPEFIQAMWKALTLCHYDGGINLFTPFKGKSKQEIAIEGHRLGVPFALTYSCYEGNELHCGQCGTCVERKEAFALAIIDDPTEYKQ